MKTYSKTKPTFIIMITTVKKGRGGSGSGSHGNRYIPESQPENVKYSSITNILSDRVRQEQIPMFVKLVDHFYIVSTFIGRKIHTLKHNEWRRKSHGGYVTFMWLLCCTSCRICHFVWAHLCLRGTHLRARLSVRLRISLYFSASFSC